MYIHFFFFPEI